MKNRILLLLMACVISLNGRAQKLGDLPAASTVDTGTYLIITENSSGTFTTYRVNAGKLAAFLDDSFSTATPGGSTGDVQLKSGSTFAGSANLNHSGTIFNVGFSGNSHLSMDVAGNSTFGRTAKFSVTNAAGVSFNTIDVANERYKMGDTDAYIVCNDVTGTDTLHALNGVVLSGLAGNGVGVVSIDNDGKLGYTAAGMSNALADGKIWIGSGAGTALARTPTGDWSISNTGTATLATVNGNTGAWGTATQVPAITLDAKGRAVAASHVTITPAWGSVTGTPTTLAGYGITDGLGTALANGKINVGNGSGIAAPQTPSGDWTMSNTAVATVTYQNTSTTSWTTAVTATSTAASQSQTVTYEATAQASDLLFALPTGSWINGQLLVFHIIFDATPRALTYNAIFHNGVAPSTTMPTTSIASKEYTFVFQYRTAGGAHFNFLSCKIN